jgi:DNA-binding response OmpR family regulator
MQKILLVGNQNWKPLQTALVAEGYRVGTTPLVSSLLFHAFEELKPDAILLEMGSDMLALQFLRQELKEELNSRPTPLIILVQQSHLSPAQFVVAVDDFVAPPHSPTEILARLKMVLWRIRKIDEQGCIRIGEVEIDSRRQEITHKGEAISLTLREYQLFVFLATHRGRTFSREAILSHIWGYAFEGDVRVVDVTMKRVRAKLPSACQSLLVTVRGVGYRMESL